MNLRRQISAFLLLLLPAVALALPYAINADNDQAFLPGRDYTVLQTAVPVATGDKIEVREFFYYGCSHCYNLESSLGVWLRNRPADVAFVRTPAVLNPKWELLGRAFYVAEELKMLEKMHMPLYTALHVHNQRIENKDAVIDFLVKLGANRAEAEKAWTSFPVNTKVKNADVLARKYLIQGTPTITVAGKYVVSAGSRMFATIDYLVGLERAARARK